MRTTRNSVQVLISLGTSVLRHLKYFMRGFHWKMVWFLLLCWVVTFVTVSQSRGFYSITRSQVQTSNLLSFFDSFGTSFLSHSKNFYDTNEEIRRKIVSYDSRSQWVRRWVNGHYTLSVWFLCVFKKWILLGLFYRRGAVLCIITTNRRHLSLTLNKERKK